MRKIIAIVLVFILVSLITILYKDKANPKDTIVCNSTCSLQDTFSNKVFEKKECDSYVNQIVLTLLEEEKKNFFGDITVIPGDVSSLTAAKSAGNLFIIYNPDYVNSLRKGVNGDMMLKGVFAHVVAHHILDHIESQEDYNYHNEDHADKYAGSIMYSFIKDSVQATNLFYSMANELIGNNQVNKNRRIIAMHDGWKSKYIPPIPPPETEPPPMADETDRIYQIKQMYEYIKKLNVINVKRGRAITNPGGSIEEGEDEGEDIHSAKITYYDQGYRVYSGTFNYYEGDDGLLIYYNNNDMFFCVYSTSAEGDTQQYRLYFDKYTNVIKMTYKEKNSDSSVRGPYDIIDSRKVQEIRRIVLDFKGQIEKMCI